MRGEAEAIIKPIRFMIRPPPRRREKEPRSERRKVKDESQKTLGMQNEKRNV